MDVLTIIGKIFKEPNDFFKKVGKEKEHFGFAFGYFALLSLVQTFLNLLFTIGIVFPFLATSFPSIYGGYTALQWTLMAVLGYGATLGFSFLWAALLYVWILIFGGKNNYVKTYELGAYAGTPSLLFGWIPFLGGIVGFVWSLVLVIIGTQHVHGLTKSRSVLMYIIPLAVVFVFLLVLIVFLVIGIVALLGSIAVAGNLSIVV